MSKFRHGHGCQKKRIILSLGGVLRCRARRQFVTISRAGSVRRRGQGRHRSHVYTTTTTTSTHRRRLGHWRNPQRERSVARVRRWLTVAGGRTPFQKGQTLRGTPVVGRSRLGDLLLVRSHAVRARRRRRKVVVIDRHSHAHAHIAIGIAKVGRVSHILAPDASTTSRAFDVPRVALAVLLLWT